MKTMDGLKTADAKTPEDWRNWLHKNHATEKKICLVICRTGEGITYDEAVDEAICYGWIDNKTMEKDEHCAYCFFSRRSPKRNWFTRNREKAERLIAEGKMMPAGTKTIEISQKNGTWTAIEEMENLEIPLDLKMELEHYLFAEFNFEAFAPNVKRSILAWIIKAKSPHTRRKRIEEAASLADKNIPVTRLEKVV